MVADDHESYLFTLVSGRLRINKRDEDDKNKILAISRLRIFATLLSK